MKIKNDKLQYNIRCKVTSSYKLICQKALALNAAINWRAKLVSEKLHRR